MESEIPSGEGLTFEKVWLMFQETDRKIEEMEAKAEKERKEREKERKEAEAKREKERKEAEVKREKERREAEVKREKERKEADARYEKRMQEQYEKTNAIIGRLGNRLGDFVEEFVRPGVVRLFNERGIPINQTARNLEATRNGKDMEVDIIGVNGEDVVVVEVKSKLGVDDVKEHLQRLARFKSFFPQYTDKCVIGAVAGMVIDKTVSRYAYRQGLFVIAQTGENVCLLNDEKFQPKRW